MPDYEKWQFEELLAEAQKDGIPGAEKLERPHLVANMVINHTISNGFLLLLAAMIINSAVWGSATLFWIPTEGTVDAAAIRTLSGVLGSINLLITLVVLGLQRRANMLRGRFKKPDQVDPKQFDLMT